MLLMWRSEAGEGHQGRRKNPKEGKLKRRMGRESIKEKIGREGRVMKDQRRIGKLSE
jgi:hypothetical protein